MKAKGKRCVVAYWGEDESYEDATDFDILSLLGNHLLSTVQRRLNSPAIHGPASSPTNLLYTVQPHLQLTCYPRSSVISTHLQSTVQPRLQLTCNPRSNLVSNSPAIHGPASSPTPPAIHGPASSPTNELRTPKTGSGTERREVTAATWQYYEDMHEVLGARPSLDPPVVVVSFYEDPSTILM
ncbi:unnamed protein product [Leuciscus chuanchicus]